MIKVYSNGINNVFSVNFEEGYNGDVAVFGFNGIDKINYKYELSGKESKLTTFAKISKKTKSVLISGVITDNYGVIKRSAVVADCGKLLGISDMNDVYEGSDYKAGGGLKIYQTSKGRIGVIVDTDLYNFEYVKAMALCDADIIICVISGEEKPEYNFLIRAYSYLFKISMLAILSGGVLASDYNGEICGGTNGGIANVILPNKKTFRLILSKRRN